MTIFFRAQAPFLGWKSNPFFHKRCCPISEELRKVVFRMISRDQATAKLLECERSLPQLYSKTAVDYRGRTISLESVRDYLAHERERFLDVVSMWPEPPGSGAKLLDVGIAYGFIPVLLNQVSGWECVGLEVGENIPIYCHLARAHNIPVHAGKLGVTPTPFLKETFQGILFSEVLEHLRLSPHLVLRELHRLLVPDGYLLVTTPHFARLANILKLLSGKNPLEGFPDVPTDNITEQLTHIREYTMLELKELLQETGFRVQKACYSSCMERGRPHGWITSLVPRWRGCLMVLARKI